jgi:hypothetical protein
MSPYWTRYEAADETSPGNVDAGRMSAMSGSG